MATLQPSSCSLSADYSINYMRYSKHYYKLSFVIDDFAQLLANISFLSTFRVGKLSNYVW